MKNVLGVHCHNPKCYLSHVTENFFCLKLLAPVLIESDFLVKTAAICIFHDDIDAIVFDERFNEFN